MRTWNWVRAAALGLALGAAGCQGESEDPFATGAAGEEGYGASQVRAENGRWATSDGAWAGQGGECAPVDVSRTEGGASIVFEATEEQLRELCAGIDSGPMRPVQYEPWRAPEPWTEPAAAEPAPRPRASRAPRRSTPAPTAARSTPHPAATSEPAPSPGRDTLVIDGEPMAVGDRVVLVLPEGEALVRDTEQGIVVTIRPYRAEDAAAMRARLRDWVDRNRVAAPDDVAGARQPGASTNPLAGYEDALRRAEAQEGASGVRPRAPRTGGAAPAGETREIVWPDTREAEPANRWDSELIPGPGTAPAPSTQPRYETIEWRDLGVVPPDPDGDGEPIPLYPQRERLMVPPRLPSHMR